MQIDALHIFAASSVPVIITASLCYRFETRTSNIQCTCGKRFHSFPQHRPTPKNTLNGKKCREPEQHNYSSLFHSPLVQSIALFWHLSFVFIEIFSVVCCRSFHFAQVPKSISLASCLPHLLFLFNFVFLADAVAGSDAVVVVVGLFFVGSFVNRSFMCIAADVSFFSSINDCLIVSLFFFISISVIQSGYMSLWFDVSVLSLSLSLYAGNNSFLASRLFSMQA